MGHNPPPPRPRSAAGFLAQYEQKLEREMRGRGSRFGWRRRRAYRACRSLIRAREAELGKIADPWILVAPPKPSSVFLTGSEAKRLCDEGILPIELEYLVPEPFRPATRTRPFIER